MDRKIISLIFVQALIIQTFTATLHPSIRQYLSLAGVAPAQLTTKGLPITISKQPPNLSSLSSIAALANLFSSATPAVPKTQSISPSALLAALSESYQTIPAIPTKATPTITPEYVESSNNNQVDASLLNNLAMAMQLLIMSNLLNSPPQETGAEPVVIPAYPLYEKTEPVTPVSVSYAQTKSQPASVVNPQPTNQNQAYYPSQYEPQQPASYPAHAQQSPAMPNANFVGASTFTDSNPLMRTAPPMSSPSPNRSGFTLMSPYEALSPSSPFSDPILSSPYGSIISSKKDFQSPYSAIMATENKDLFSMSDFF